MLLVNKSTIKVIDKSRKRMLLAVLVISTIAIILAIVYFQYTKTVNFQEDDLLLIDVHNHDAYKYEKSINTWNEFSVDKIVLFGSISEPAAKITDKQAYEAFTKYPERIIPFIAGIDIHNEECLTYIYESLEKGYMGIGEIVAASSYSPIASQVEWKAEHPMDGYFPAVYELCGDYNIPLLLHVDPLHGYVLDQLKTALETFPETTIILGHGNAHNNKHILRQLLDKYPNLYIDFFSGFNAYNDESSETLEDYVQLITDYSDRFLISSDSGYGINYDEAYKSMYELFKLLDSDTVQMIAGENFLQLIHSQEITEWQQQKIQTIVNDKNLDIDIDSMNKYEAAIWIVENE